MSMYRIMHVKRVFMLFIIISIIGIIVLIARPSVIDDFDRQFRLKKIDELIKLNNHNLGCKQPILPVFSPEIMKFVKTVPKIDCSKAGDDWVKCIGNECTIQESVKIEHGPVKCSFTDIIRVDDFQITDGQTTTSDSTYKLTKSDVVRVSCTGSDKKWSATLTGIRWDPEIFDSTWDFKSESSVKMNVLMFGFDSLSRNSFIRKLPKSYEYLTKVLQADILQGYNIIGDGTPQALIPILTGKTELELPDTRKRYKNSKSVNIYPFIWNDFKKAGYVTGFFEDVPELGTFTYRLNGFQDTPVDHYMRTYYFASLKERKKWPKLCAGEIPMHKVMFNTIKDFYHVYQSRPKFLFAFHGELSHDDYNLVGVADDDLKEMLSDLYHSAALNNTILIMMADHGHRFADIRNTLQGKQEERLPFFSFRFPESFKKMNRKAYDNFRDNLDKLVTPLDIYETLKSVLNLDNLSVADITKRSVSLFSKIPWERSCGHAYIEPHWCACLEWEKLNLSKPIVNRVAETLLSTLNDYTQDHRDICERLSIKDIIWVTKLKPNEKFLTFQKNADMDGFVGDFSAKMKLKSNMYQIKVMLVPGNSLFEASLTHYLSEDRFEMKMSDVSRINMYGSQAKCVENAFPHLRKYCYCKD